MALLMSGILTLPITSVMHACTKALAKNKISLFEAALHGHEVINVDLIA